jgi:hypothetical protein
MSRCSLGASSKNRVFPLGCRFLSIWGCAVARKGASYWCVDDDAPGVQGPREQTGETI